MFAILLLAAIGAELPAASPSRPPDAAAAIHADALQLAELMAPRDVMLAGELRQFDLHFRQTILNGRTVEEVDGEYPGLTDAIVAAARPLVVKAAGRALDEIYPKVGQVIQARLTGDEIAQLQTFYRTGAGRTIVRGMAATADAGAIYKQAVEQPDAPVTEQQVASHIRSAAAKASENFSDADKSALLEFMKMPVFPKLAGMQPSIRQIVADAHNRKDPELEAVMDETLAEAASAHMRRVDAKRGK
jgi:hypothetical protein